MTLKKFCLKHRRTLLISGGIILALLVLMFISARPWRLAASLRDLEELSASFRRAYPCHEDCLIKRLGLENKLAAALEEKQPGLAEIMAAKIKDDSQDASFRRSLDRIIKSSAYEND
ncbi:MAG: hypothetical protein WC441_01360 [Patescibacteria group bacterium]